MIVTDQEFQSLFCWKLFCNFMTCISGFKIPRSSFNPCFAGSCFATIRIQQEQIIFQGFQSLFCWKLFCNDKDIGVVVSDVYSFNPCFAGSCFATKSPISLLDNEEVRCFNPCFAGSCFATKDILTEEQKPRIEFQSLFCWKLFCNRN